MKLWKISRLVGKKYEYKMDLNLKKKHNAHAYCQKLLHSLDVNKDVSIIIKNNSFSSKCIECEIIYDSSHD